MGCYCDRRPMRNYYDHFDRRRGTDTQLNVVPNPVFELISIASSSSTSKPPKTIQSPKIASAEHGFLSYFTQRRSTFRRERRKLSLASSSITNAIVRREYRYSSPTTKKDLRHVILCILFFVLGFCSTGTASSCVAEQCGADFYRALDHDKVLIGPNLPYCTLLKAYGLCLNRTSRACRGDLKFHSLSTMVTKSNRDQGCAALIERRRMGTNSKTQKSLKSANATSDSPDEDMDMNGGDGTTNTGRCLFPYQHQKGASGYRYCSIFGDPHLRTFDGHYETCRTLGAWPLLDNSYFGVQVTNDPVADGLDASGVSKITVIVKSLPGCSDQKMYEATKDLLPSTFVDGTTNSGEPNTNSVSGASYSYHYRASLDNRGGVEDVDNRPAVLVRTVDPDRHVEIHLRHIATRVVIRRVGNYLTMAIKMPEEVLFQRSSLNSLQVCLTGCPSTERINYKEVLAYPEYYLAKWGARNPAVTREHAVDVCREAGVTDFFFDSCVFDLLMTGDESFKDSALAAMNDIRHLYPPYRKHYETRRADLSVYDGLAELGRRQENAERERGHKRRQPASDWNIDHRSKQSPVGIDRENSNSGTTSSNSIHFGTLIFFLIIAAYPTLVSRRITGEYDTGIVTRIR